MGGIKAYHLPYSSRSIIATAIFHLFVLQLLHQPSSNFCIDDASKPKGWDDPAHPGERTSRPILAHLPHPLGQGRPWPIIQIQAPKMQRRRKHLHRRRCQYLCQAGSAHDLFHLCRYHGRHQRWEIEACEHSHRVAQSKKGEAGFRDRSGQCRCGTARSAEHLGKLTVFVEAERHVDGAGSEEFGGSGGCVSDRRRGKSTRDGIDGVGGKVSAEVDHGD